MQISQGRLSLSEIYLKKMYAFYTERVITLFTLCTYCNISYFHYLVRPALLLVVSFIEQRTQRTV